MTSRAPTLSQYPHTDHDLPPIRRIVALLARQAAREWVASCNAGRPPAAGNGTDERSERHGKS